MHVFQCKFSQLFNIYIMKKILLCATQVVRVENGKRYIFSSPEPKAHR